MASDRPNQTLADYVAIAISPALIMALVGSLVFFLLEVCYPTQGAYKDRLQWILFFFVFGAVLVGRISLTQGIAGRAGLYGVVLAGLTWIGMQVYVDYAEAGPVAAFAPLINLFLVGLVWWCAHKLTWDCTDVREDVEVNAEGLLQATGLEKPAGDSGTQPAGKVEKTDKKEEKAKDGAIGWWERFRRYREERKKKRVLGGWVIYFSLAALPLFGLGEALIPADETGRRQYAFWLMAAYVGSGLGLLATTCFLGLRRYLRQRRLQMPVAMTAAWLTAAGALTLGLLLIGALLPRPNPEVSLLSVATGGGDKKSASNLATQGGSSGKGDGNRIGDQPKDKGDPAAADKDGQASAKDKGQPVPDKDKGDAAGDKDKDGSGKSSEKDKDKGDNSNRANGNDSPDPNKNKTDPNAPQQPKDGKPPNRSGQQNPQKSGQPSQSSGTSQLASSWDWSKVLETVSTVLKWIVFALLILAVIFFLLREGLKFLANFTDWAKNLLDALRKLWAGLFRRRAVRDHEGADSVQTAPSRSRLVEPFAAYANPFTDGTAARRPIKEVVRYTFDALQAWARERGAERRPEETPLEFAARLGAEFPALEADVRRFASLYARSVYDYSPLPAAATEQVRRFWERLETAAEQPLSA